MSQQGRAPECRWLLSCCQRLLDASLQLLLLLLMLLPAASLVELDRSRTLAHHTLHDVAGRVIERHEWLASVGQRGYGVPRGLLFVQVQLRSYHFDTPGETWCCAAAEDIGDCARSAWLRWPAIVGRCPSRAS